MKATLFLLLTSLVFLTSYGQTGKDAQSPKDWFDKGVSFKNSEKYKEAIDAFKKAAAADANYGDAWHQLGWCYNEQALYNEAITALKQEEKAKSSDPTSMNLELGYAYKGLKKYEESIPYFDKAIDGDNNYALAYKERGNAYNKLKDYTKSLADYNRYAELAKDIKDEVFYYNKGWMENDLEKYNEAIESLKKCVELDDEYADGYSELGYAYYKLNLNDDAVTSYRNAIQLDKETSASSLLGLADVYYDNLKNYDSAVVYYAKGVQLRKTSKSAFYRLGWCYNDQKKYADAVSPLKQAVALDAAFTNAVTELGFAYYKLEEYDNALAQFKQAMGMDAKNKLSRYYAGNCYYYKNDQENLKRMINELRDLNANDYVDNLSKLVK